jgi:predicted PurR-regulated permease PerM
MPERIAEVGVLSRSRVQALALITATALSLYLCYRLVQPFVPALSWGLALAVVGYPLHKIICRRIPHATVAAAMTVAVIAIAIIAPVTFVTQQLVRQVMGAATLVQQSLQAGTWRQAIEREPHVAAVAGWLESAVSLDDAVTRLAAAIEQWAPTVVVGSVAAIMQLLITVLVLFYFFRDKRDLSADARSYLPLSEAETDVVIRRVTDTIQATVFGSLVVAAVQGFMGGLMFWLLGLPAPVVWGAVMAVLATIPVAGTFVVWAPAAVFLAITGAWVKALALVGWGAVAIGLIDNVLYPMLVGKRLRFHPLPVFFSIVGGLSVFGAAGLVLGPLVLSVTTALLEVLRRRTSGGAAADARTTTSSAA